jgi:HK97 gp10 family phage protein
MPLSIKARVKDGAIQALARKLNEFDRKASRKAIKKGVNEATKLVTADAKANVPRKTGLLKKSIGRRVRSYRGGTVISGIVGPRSGFATVLASGKKVNPAKYAHLVEFGRKAVRVKKAALLADKFAKQVFGVEVAAVAPRPFLRPAWDKNETRAVGELAKALNEAIAEFARGARTRR